MTTSAIVLMAMGILLTFAPDDVQAIFTPHDQTRTVSLILQILGALYFAFGMINWTAKANLIGGIYGRPIAIGNLCHFTIGGLAVIKAYLSTGEAMILPLLFIYVPLGIAFGVVFFTHPLPEKTA
jgi:hypothetical protein